MSLESALISMHQAQGQAGVLFAFLFLSQPGEGVKEIV
jgi:hypothetical protein